MGIYGLSTYMQANADRALQWHRLRNCKLVIDGNNLAYDILANCYINAAFGGDYDIYVQKIKSFFGKLKMCNITPYVVMDGGHPTKEDKFQTVYSRIKEQTNNCLSISFKKKLFLFPILGKSVFIHTLHSLNVNVIQADFEADTELVIIARKLKAPVLSNDSDFFLFDVPFILLNTLNLEEGLEPDEDEKYIPCYRFNMSLFCKDLKIRKDLIPLIAPLLGNDCFGMHVMRYFRKTLFKNASPHKLHSRSMEIRSVIKWLSTKDENKNIVCKEIFSVMKNGLTKEEHTQFERVLSTYYPSSKSALSSWTDRHTQECLSRTYDSTVPSSKLPNGCPEWMHLQFECSCDSRSKSTLVEGSDLPDWFVRSLRLGFIPHIVSDIMDNSFVFTPPPVECVKMEHSYVQLKPLLKRIIALIWTVIYHSIAKQKGIDLQIPSSENVPHTESDLKEKLRKTATFLELNSEKYKINDNFHLEPSNSTNKTLEGFFTENLTGLKTKPDLIDYCTKNYEYRKSHSDSDNQSDYTDAVESLSLNSFSDSDSDSTSEEVSASDSDVLSTKDDGELSNQLYNDSDSEDAGEEGEPSMAARCLADSSSEEDDGDLESNDSSSEWEKEVDLELRESHVIEEKTDRINRFFETKIVPSIQWFSRKGKRLENVNIGSNSIVYILDNIPSLYDIDKESIVVRKDAFFRVMKFWPLFGEDLPLPIEYVLVCVAYWQQRYQEVAVPHLMAVLCSLFMYYVVEPKVDLENLVGVEAAHNRLKKALESGNLADPSKLSVKELIGSLTRDECVCAAAALSSFQLLPKKKFPMKFSESKNKSSNRIQKRPKHYKRIDNYFAKTKKRELLKIKNKLVQEKRQQKPINPNNALMRLFKNSLYKKTRVHVFSQFQTVVYMLQMLNSLLFFPFPILSVEKFFNGSFCFNVCSVFAKFSSAPAVALRSLFQDNPRVAHLIARLFNALPPFNDQPLFDMWEDCASVEMSDLGLSHFGRTYGIRKRATADDFAKNLMKQSNDPEFEYIQEPTEDDLNTFAGNKFSALFLKQ